MLESNILEGNQQFDCYSNCKPEYGISITDPCIGWDDTEELLKWIYENVRYN